jgi:hypothetical protein
VSRPTTRSVIGEIAKLSRVTSRAHLILAGRSVPFERRWYDVQDEWGFANGWENDEPVTYNRAAVFLDASGFVNLRGRVRNSVGTTSGVIFHLPPQFSPATLQRLPVMNGRMFPGETNYLLIHADGTVEHTQTSLAQTWPWVALDSKGWFAG